jgi:hypothetical protein
MHAAYPTFKNKQSFKGVNMVCELRTMQNTTRFRELFLHSTDKPCSKLLTENQHSLCYTWGSLPQWRIFSEHCCKGSHIATTNPQELTLPQILFTLGSNTLYSCQKQVICSWKYAWLFLELQPQSPKTNSQRVALYHHTHDRQEDCKVSTVDEVIEQ